MKQSSTNKTTSAAPIDNSGDGPHCIRCAIGQASLVIVIVALCVYFLKLA